MFWKIYFFIYLGLVTLGNYTIYKNLINFDFTINFADTCITLFSIIPLFLFSFKRKNRLPWFWKAYYVLFLFIEFSYLPQFLHSNNGKLIEALAGILLSFPAYVGIYLFAFPNGFSKKEPASR